MGNALFTTTALAIIVGVATGTHEDAITLYEASLGFGIACGPLLGAQSWRLPFAGASIIMVLAFVFGLLTVSEPDTEHKQGVGSIVATFRHTGVRTNAVVGLLYRSGSLRFSHIRHSSSASARSRSESCSSHGGCWSLLGRLSSRHT